MASSAGGLPRSPSSMLLLFDETVQVDPAQIAFATTLPAAAFKVIPVTPSPSLASLYGPQLESMLNAEQKAFYAKEMEKSPPPKIAGIRARLEALKPAIAWQSEKPGNSALMRPDSKEPSFASTIFGRFDPHSPERMMQFFMYLNGACFPAWRSKDSGNINKQLNILYDLNEERLHAFTEPKLDEKVISNLRKIWSSKLQPLSLSSARTFTYTNEEDVGVGHPEFKMMPVQGIVAEALALAFATRGKQRLTNCNHRVGILQCLAYLFGHNIFPKESVNKHAFVFRLYTFIHSEHIYMESQRTTDYHLGPTSEWHIPFRDAHNYVRKNVMPLQSAYDEKDTQIRFHFYAKIVRTDLPIYLGELHGMYQNARKEKIWASVTGRYELDGHRLGLHHGNNPPKLKTPYSTQALTEAYTRNQRLLTLRAERKLPNPFEKPVKTYIN